MVTYLGSLVQLCCGEGGTLQANITGTCGECSQCLGHTGFAPTQCVCFPGLHCSGSRLLCRGTKVGPGLCALPRCTLLRFWFSGTPQRHRLSWPSLLCPFQVQAAQETRCLASGASYYLPRPSCSVSWVHSESAVSGVPRVSSGELIWLQPSWWMSTIQDPRMT